MGNGHALRGDTLVTEGDGLFRREVNYNITICTCFGGILDGLVFAIRKDGVIVPWMLAVLRSLRL